MQTPFESNRQQSGIATGTTIRRRLQAVLLVSAAVAIPTSMAQQAGSAGTMPIPAEKAAAANADPDWEAPRFSWGDPDIEGTFTSRDMGGIQMERSPQHGTRESLTEEEFLQRATGGAGGLAAMRQGAEFEGEERLQLSALDSSEVGTRTFGYTSYLIDPPDGRLPAMTAAARERRAGRGGGGQANGPFFSMEDFSYYDRCITRGITGSILPSLYGDAMRIVQSPTEVAISYEMLHDTRIIPLDGRAQADPNVRQFMGSSVGHWEGDTLVITTTNLTEELGIGRNATSPDTVLTERITRIDPEMINYVVTVDDPATYERPWTFRVTLTTQPGYDVLEYSCHEGNFFVANALRAEKRYQEQVAEAIANGDPVPERSTGGGGGFLDIYQAPSSDEAIDINAGE